MKNKIKISFNAPVTLIYVFICLLALILNVVTSSKSNELLFSVYKSSYTDVFSYFRIFGHVFGHSGTQHFMSNVTFLLILGPLLEEKYGKFAIIEVIGVVAVVTGIANIILFPNTALLGASGVVFAFIILSSITNISKGNIPLTFILVSFIYIGQEIYSAVFIVDNISNLTHILGGIIGAIWGNFVLNRKKNY